jgi:protein TonB
MHTRLRLPLVFGLALVLGACGEAPTPGGSPAAAPAAADAAVPVAADLDTEALRQRASAALAANRLFVPAGNNAVEDYLALRDRLPDDLAVATALLDLAPYVVIGAEQAKAAGQFDEAQRLIDLLLRMDPEAPAAPRLREGLAAARQAAETQIEADRLTAETAAREAASRAAAARAAPPVAAPAVVTPAAPVVADPAPRPAVQPTVAPPPPPPPPIPSPGPRAARPLVAQSAPRFPEQAQRRRLEGSVQLQLQVAADGSVLSAEVISSTHPVFEREAVLAARRWRFAPATSASTERVDVAFRQPEA